MTKSTLMGRKDVNRRNWMFCWSEYWLRTCYRFKRRIGLDYFREITSVWLCACSRALQKNQWSEAMYNRLCYLCRSTLRVAFQPGFCATRADGWHIFPVWVAVVLDVFLCGSWGGCPSGPIEKFEKYQAYVHSLKRLHAQGAGKTGEYRLLVDSSALRGLLSSDYNQNSIWIQTKIHQRT